MFYLQTSVHFEEVEALAGLVRTANDKLHGASRLVFDGFATRATALRTHGFTHRCRDTSSGEGASSIDFLVAPLDRAFALVQIQDIAVLIAKDLDLDMARVLQ